MRKFIALVLLVVLISAIAFYGVTVLIQYRSQTNQSIAQLQNEVGLLRDENQKTDALLIAAEQELSSLREDVGGQLTQLQNQLVQQVQQVQQKDAYFDASVANLRDSLENGLTSEKKQREGAIALLQSNIADFRSSLEEDMASEKEQRESDMRLLQSNVANLRSSLEENILSEREQRKSDVKRLQADDEELRQQAAKDAKELRIAMESLRTGVESNANNFQNLVNYLYAIENDILTRLEKDYVRTTELEELKKTVELFIEEIRILEDEEVEENLAAPKRTSEVYPVLLLASDDKEPTENEKQEMLRSLAVARAWYEDKTSETFKFNTLAVIRSPHDANWLRTCPISPVSGAIKDEAILSWECVQYELGDRRIPGLPRLWSNSVYFVFMPSFQPKFRLLGQGAFYNEGGLAMVGETVMSQLSKNDGDRLKALEVVAHELGHTFNLHHVDDPDFLMSSKNTGYFPKVKITPLEAETLTESPFFE